MSLNKIIINGVNSIWRSKNIISTLLLPLACITNAVVKRKINKYKNKHAWHPNIPVIVVGNIYVGGTGKTPVVIELVKFLQKNGYTPAVISRGYGVKANKQAMLGTHLLNPKVFGDEPALIAQQTSATIAVHPKRVKAAKAILENNKFIRGNNQDNINKVDANIATHAAEIDVIIMDDGLQHLQIDRDIEIIVQDTRGIGNGRLLPAGPLREPAEKLKQVDIIINNGFEQQNQTKNNAQTTKTLSNQFSDSNLASIPNLDSASKTETPINTYMDLFAYSVTQLNSNKTVDWDVWLEKHSDKNISALAGIGNPSRFFNMLKKDLKNLNNLYPLPDHAKSDAYDFKNIANDIVLITGKDAIKCSHINDDRIWVVNAKPQFNSDLWLQYILSKLNNWKNHASQTN